MSENEKLELLKELLAEFLKRKDRIEREMKKLRVLVLGDVMLDVYLFGDATRISPEAPIPIVHIVSSERKVGGAGNTALNIKKFANCNVKILSVVGFDKEGRTLKKMLESEGIEAFLVKERSRPTITKTRVVARGQQVLRIDREKTHRISTRVLQKVLEGLSRERFDVCVVSDYAKGFVRGEIFDMLESVPVVIDPKPQNFGEYRRADVVLPNKAEAESIAGFQARSDREHEKLAKKIMEKLPTLKTVVITRGEKGMTVFTEGKKAFHLPAIAHNVYDITGAGDTVTAIFSVLWTLGVEPEVSCAVATVGASLKVEHLGTWAVGWDEVIRKTVNFLKNES